MKALVSAIRSMGGLVALALALGCLLGCSDGGANGPAPGVATIGFVPKALTNPYISLQRAQVRLDRLQLIGNVPPPPSSSQPPSDNNHPPPQNPPPQNSGVDLDLSTGSSATMEHLQQGLYSRVRFMLGRISLDGMARGTVFHVSLAPFGATVDVRASQPQELGLDQDVSFQISVDPNIWFPPYLFDGAMLDDRGQIVSDDVSNPQIGSTLIQTIAASFSLP